MAHPLVPRLEISSAILAGRETGRNIEEIPVEDC